MAKWASMRHMRRSCPWRCRIMAIPTAMSPSAISGSSGWRPTSRSGGFDAELGQRGVEMRHRLLCGTGIVAGHWCVADITDILHAFRQGIEAAHQQSAQPGEEKRRTLIAGLHLGLEGDAVEDQIGRA